MQWDPIGVADVPECANEYDCMIGPLRKHLNGGATKREMTHLLSREIVDHFGLPVDRRRERACASALVDWWRHSSPLD